MAPTPGRRALAVRHTAAWVLANVSEFDRRHLYGFLRWLDERPSQRLTRPARRSVRLVVVAVWAWLLAVSFGAWQWGAVVAPALILAVLASDGLAARRKRRNPPVPVRLHVLVEMSDCTLVPRAVAPDANVTITRGSYYPGDQVHPTEIHVS